MPDYEDAVGPISINDQIKYILLKRDQPKESQKYLENLNSELVPIFKPYSVFKTLEDAEEKAKVLSLKEKISKVSFVFLKLLMTSLNNEHLQETIINELFKEITNVSSSFSLSLDETCFGNTWIGKIMVPTSWQRNPMEIFLKKLYSQTDEDLIIRKIIENHVGIIDHSLKGVLDQDDESALSDNAKKLIGKHPEFRNSKCQIDFFSYLNVIFDKKEELDEESRNFLEKSKIFNNLPKDFYEAAERSSLVNVSNIVLLAISESKCQDFISFLSCFAESETPGISESGSFPEEFKNSDGKYDFYLGINKISSDPDKYPSYYPDVQVLIQEFGSFPSSCLFLTTEQILIEDYQGTILWLIFSQCSHAGVLTALSRKKRLVSLLTKAVSNSQELSALSMMILTQTLPTQHSFETISSI